MTLEDRLAVWLTQPGAYISAAEHKFIEDMRTAAASGVGYGWMQQIIEWEWQSRGDGAGAFGPEYFEKKIARLEAACDASVVLSNAARLDFQYMIREAPRRGGYMWEGARRAHEAGTYHDPVLEELLAKGAIKPHSDSTKGYIVADPRLAD